MKRIACLVAFVLLMAMIVLCATAMCDVNDQTGEDVVTMSTGPPQLAGLDISTLLATSVVETHDDAEDPAGVTVLKCFISAASTYETTNPGRSGRLLWYKFRHRSAESLHRWVSGSA